MRLPAFILLFRLTIIGTAAFLLFTGASCAPRAQPTAGRAAPTRPVVIGEVAVVDEEKKFVLIDLDSNLYVPAPGTTLRATNASGGTAHLRASPEQKRPFIAADIVDGDPAVGDQVER
jgi:hypothetical protein